MNCMVITAGETDAAIIRRLVAPPAVRGPVAVIAAAGRSSAVSQARSYLITRPDAVALLVDADTTDVRRASEMKSDLDALLHMIAASSRSEVFMALPSIEAVFFYNRETAMRVFGADYDTEQRVRSEFQPKVVIEGLLRRQGKRYSESIGELIDAFGPDQLRQVPLITNLIAFTRRSTAAAVA